MAKNYDTIVIGLGAMGSAALYQLAKKGNKVLGLDQFSPPHVYGSTHGETRVTRLAIGEGSHYTPLAQRSHQLWREIERETGQNLLTTNGILIISSPARTAINHVAHFFENTIAAAREHGIAHELLDAETIRKRFPPFKIRDNESGYFERDAGFVRPEECVAAQLGLAKKYGAEIHVNEKVMEYKAARDVKVTTEQNTYTAEKLVITAGPWVSQMIDAEYSRHFKVRRVPKVTVTREGDSLCQKGCYPLALVFVNSSSSCNPTPVVKSAPREPLPSLLAVERSGAWRRQPPSPAERNRQQGSASDFSPPFHFLTAAPGASPRWPSIPGIPPA